MAPIIGISPSPTLETMPHGTFRKWSIAAAYVDAIAAAGGVPVVLPPHPGDPLRVLDAVDGLLLSGGGDLDPATYGDPAPHPATYGVDAERDSFELALAREAVARDVPTLCICRGIQVLNVALGGTLVQDVPDGIGRELQHRQHEAGIDAAEPGHPVRPTGASPLIVPFGDRPFGVNSFHHQAVRDLAPALLPAAVSDDGVVEAAFHPDRRFVVGVQWHPELMAGRHAAQLDLFRAFVEAARSRTLSDVAR